MKIIAIGGGELKERETLDIDKEIINQTFKKNPKALLIPTASGDSKGYKETFDKIYGDYLECKTDVLNLIKKDLSPKEIEEKVLSSDLIYVGGGNTEEMMRVWKKNKVDILLKKAGERGIVLSGLSAGSYCWFDKSLSSSKEKIYEGLGFINLNNVCHYSKENKKLIFKNYEKIKGPVIALENNSAIEIINDKIKIIVSNSSSNAYILSRKEKKIIEKVLPINKFIPIKNLK